MMKHIKLLPTFVVALQLAAVPASAQSTVGPNPRDARSAAILMNREVRDVRWKTHFDGVQASASYSFNHATIIENQREVRNGPASGLLMLQCGSDGFSIAISIAHEFSDLAAAKAIPISIGGKAYSFLREKDLFVASSSTISKAQFNEILLHLYRETILQFYLPRQRISLDLYLEWAGSREYQRQKDSIGLIRSACR